MNDFRETDPVDVRQEQRQRLTQEQEQWQEQREQQKRQQRQRAGAKERARTATKAKAARITAKAKGWSRANHDKMVNEVEVENANAEPGKEYVYTIEHENNYVNLSQDGCAECEDGLVMIDSGASVNVCPKWFGNSKLERSDGACLRSANGKPLQEHGKRQIWLRMCGQTQRYDFHAVNVTKPILGVTCLCEQRVETHEMDTSR